jgi:hypothetical protein
VQDGVFLRSGLAFEMGSFLRREDVHHFEKMAWRIVGVSIAFALAYCGGGHLEVGMGKGPVYKNMHLSWRFFDRIGEPVELGILSSRAHIVLLENILE